MCVSVCLSLVVKVLNRVCVSVSVCLQVSGFSPPKPCVSFAHFGFDEEMMRLIRKLEFSQPTPIQVQVCPLSPFKWVVVMVLCFILRLFRQLCVGVTSLVLPRRALGRLWRSSGLS